MCRNTVMCKDSPPPPPVLELRDYRLEIGGAPKREVSDIQLSPPPLAAFFVTCATFEACGGPEKHSVCEPPPLWWRSWIRPYLNILKSMVLIIPDSQHGFLPKRSCTTQAVSLFYEWAKILDRSTPPRIDAVFLDWAKAFDKVNHHVYTIEKIT